MKYTKEYLKLIQESVTEHHNEEEEFPEELLNISSKDILDLMSSQVEEDEENEELAELYEKLEKWLVDNQAALVPKEEESAEDDEDAADDEGEEVEDLEDVNMDDEEMLTQSSCNRKKVK